MKEYFDKWVDNLGPWMADHGIRIVWIIGLAILLHFILKKFIIRAVRIAVKPDKHQSDDAEKKRERTLVLILSGATRVVIYTLAVMMVLQELGVEIGPILAAAGIVGIAFGFGGQYLIRDLISGLFIIFENQYRVGDMVRFDTISGIVEDISLRMTTLRDLDGTVHHVPHGEIKTVSNLSKNFARVNLNIGVGYSSNLEKVIEVVNQTGIDLANDPAWKSRILSPPQFLRVNDFGDSAIEIKIVGDTEALKQWEVTGEFRKRIKVAFDKAGIEIPFPQRVVHQAK